ncbi:MAG TPA: hypothetical protein VIJ48_01660 [Acidimicrobiia bacterium]
MNQYPGHNPYAPPQAPVANAGYGPGAYGPPSARVDGKLLVAANGSPLPAMCMKCGGPPTHWRAQNYRYTPQWAMLIGWIGILIFSKKSSFQIPLCEEHRAAWKKWNLIAGLSCLPGVVLWVLAGIVGMDSDAGVGLFFVGLVAFFVGLIGTLIARARKVVMPTKIDKTHSWLRGVHPAVLQAVSAPHGPQAPGAYPMRPQQNGG